MDIPAHSVNNTVLSDHPRNDSNKSAMRPRRKKFTKTFTEALKERYCLDQDPPTFGYIICSPKRKSNAAAELAHLKTVVLNELNLNRAGIPQQGLTSLCPNVIDLDLANNDFDNWSEVMAVLAHLPQVKYVNVSRNKLKLDQKEPLPDTKLSVENLAVNGTGVSIEDMMVLSAAMPELKELHLCDNDYDSLSSIEDGIQQGHFSSLECLRLNDNKIRKWSEVWKLRALPQLRRLILSGNPVEEIFYTDQIPETNQQPSFPACDDKASQNDILHEFSNLTDDTTSQNGELHEFSNPTDEVGLMDIEVDIGEDVSEGTQDDGSQSLDISIDNQSFDISVDSCDYEDVAECDFDDLRPVSRLGQYPDTQIDNTHFHRDVPTDGSRSALWFHSAYCVNNVNKNCEDGYEWNSDRQSPLYMHGRGSVELADVGESVLDDSDAESEHSMCKLGAEEFLSTIMDNLGLSPFPSVSSPMSCENCGSEDAQPPASNSSGVSQSLSQQVGQSGGKNQSFLYQNGYRIPPLPSDHCTGAQGLNNGQTHCVENPAAATAVGSQRVPPKNAEIDYQGSAEPALKVNSQTNVTAESSSHASNSGFEQFIHKTFETSSRLPAEEGGSNPGHSAQGNTSATVKAKTDSEAGQPPICSSQAISSTAFLYPLNSVHTPEESMKLLKNADETMNAAAAHASELRTHQTEYGKCTYQDTNCHSNVDKYTNETAQVAKYTSETTKDTHLEDTGCHKDNDNCTHQNTQVATTTSEATEEDAKSCLNPLKSVISPPETQQTNPIIEDRSPQIDTPCEDPLISDPTGTTVDQRSDIELNDHQGDVQPPAPFHQLEMLCLSNAALSHWAHLQALQAFPKLVNVRVSNNPLYNSRGPEDKRKMYIASLPKVSVLNGSEVTAPEREKAERHYLRYFMDHEDKPGFFHEHVKKHGQPTQLVDINIGAGYQDYATLSFVYEGATKFSKRLFLRDPVGKLRLLISKEIDLPKHSFILFHYSCGPSHPESERELMELRCESLPMSRFDFADGDEIYIGMK